MSTLNLDQKLSLTEQLAEVLSYEDPERNYPEHLAHEVVDSWLPIYYHAIIEEWVNAGSPRVDDTGLLSETHAGDVHHIAQVALYEQGLAWVSHLFWNYHEEEVETAGQALEACNTYLAVRGLPIMAANGKRVGRVATW